MSQTLNAAIIVVGIDIGKNSFHVVGHDERGAIVLRQKWSRSRMKRDGGSVFPAPANTGDPNGPLRPFRQWDRGRADIHDGQEKKTLLREVRYSPDRDQIADVD